MNPTPGDVHVNTPLSNISVAYMQKATNFVADRIFPNIPVQKQSDLFWTFNQGDFNRDEMKLRAPGTESEGGGFRVGTDTYYAPVYAFHRDIHDEVRANADNALAPDRLATMFVSNKALIKREKLFVTQFFATGIWGFERAGVASGVDGTEFLRWDDAASTPIEDVRRAKREMMEQTGFEPNVLVLGRPVYDALLDHPDVIDRVKYGQTPGAPAMATREALARLFEIEKIEVMNAVENTAKEGQTAVHAFIGGKHAMFAYAAPEPGNETASAGYTFSWTGHLGAGAMGGRIRSFRMEALKSDRVEIEMAFVQKLIGTKLGYFFKDAVS
jgi:hypothetical protein